jgi:pimeloyl-ACP methyl ester carboxylesterase
MAQGGIDECSAVNATSDGCLAICRAGCWERTLARAPWRTRMGVTAEKSTDATAIRPLTGEIPKAERGGHFAAWEEPQLFAEELRAAFRSLR